MSLCLVIPSYRDSARLEKYLPELCASLERVPGVSILVVDDGSGAEEAEKTRMVASRLREKHLILLPPLLLEPTEARVEQFMPAGMPHRSSSGWPLRMPMGRPRLARWRVSFASLWRMSRPPTSILPAA